MKNIAMVLAVICFSITAFINPIAVGWAVYQWGGVGLDIGPAAWEGVKVWFTFIWTFIPGFLLYVYATTPIKR